MKKFLILLVFVGAIGGGWYAYSREHQTLIEQCYQAHAGGAQESVVLFDIEGNTYAIDVAANTQTNMSTNNATPVQRSTSNPVDNRLTQDMQDMVDQGFVSLQQALELCGHSSGGSSSLAAEMSKVDGFEVAGKLQRANIVLDAVVIGADENLTLKAIC